MAENIIKSSYKFHPLQLKRMELERKYEQTREELDTQFKQDLKELQEECTHTYEDGRSSKEDAPPFGDKYCIICHKDEW